MRKSLLLQGSLEISSSSIKIPVCESAEDFFTLRSKKRKCPNLMDSVFKSVCIPTANQKEASSYQDLTWGKTNFDTQTTITSATSTDGSLSFKNIKQKKKQNPVCESMILSPQNLYPLRPPPARIAPPDFKKYKLDDFMVLKKLGEGSYSEVFLSVEKKTGFVCALKVVNKEHMKKQNLINVLAREIKVHQYLKHKNVVDLYGCFDDANRVYLICQYCTNGDMFQLIRNKRKHCQDFSISEISTYLRQLCEAVEAMHNDYLMHRDIKPENIFLTMGDCVKLGDFGWSVYFGNKELRHTQCGTPSYLAPELIGQCEYSETVDIWAIGVLAYELLSGESPFEIRTAKDLSKVLTEEINFDYIENQVGRDFVRRLLEKDVNLRMEIEDVLDHPFLSEHTEELEMEE